MPHGKPSATSRMAESELLEIHYSRKARKVTAKDQLFENSEN